MKKYILKTCCRMHASMMAVVDWIAKGRWRRDHAGGERAEAKVGG